MSSFQASPGIGATVLDVLDRGIIVLDGDHCIRFWNAWMEQAAGMARSATIGRSIWKILPELLATRLSETVNDALEAGASSILTHSLHPELLFLKLPDGRPLLHSLIIRPLWQQGAGGCLIQISDITATVERESLLRERRDARYRAVVDTAQDAIVTTDSSGTLQWMNAAAERVFGLPTREAIGQDIGLLLSPGDVIHWPRNRSTTRSGETIQQAVELTGRERGGAPLNLELSLAGWRSDGRIFITGIFRDVTERLRIRNALEQAVADKTVLLREINHRVKNSLQLVSGLLNLQLASVQDNAARALLQAASERISAVARVHQRLYQADQYRTLNFGAFLSELCDDLMQASADSVCAIRLEADPLEINIDHAAPLGLIVNELIVNAIKHRGADPCCLAVTLKGELGTCYTITVTDQGPGLPAGFDAERSPTLGMRIVTALTRQIGAVLEILPVPEGASFRLTVPGSEAVSGERQD